MSRVSQSTIDDRYRILCNIKPAQTTLAPSIFRSVFSRVLSASSFRDGANVEVTGKRGKAEIIDQRNREIILEKSPIVQEVLTSHDNSRTSISTELIGLILPTT